MRVNCREQIANPAESVNGQDERRKCAAVDSPARLCCSVIKRATAPPFDKGRAWMPEVERPEFRKDAKLAERSLKGKGDSARQRDYCPFAMVVRMERLGATGGASKARMP